MPRKTIQRRDDRRIAVRHCYDIHGLIRLMLIEAGQNNYRNTVYYAVTAMEMLGQRYLDKFPSPKNPRITSRHQNHALAKRLIIGAQAKGQLKSEEDVWQFLAETFIQPSYLDNQVQNYDCQEAAHPHYTPVRFGKSKHGWLADRIVELFYERTGHQIDLHRFGVDQKGRGELVAALMQAFQRPYPPHIARYTPDYLRQRVAKL